MVAVGLALLWVSYVLFWYSVTLFHSMNIGILDLVIPGRYDLCHFHRDYANALDMKKTGGCPGQDKSKKGGG